MLPLQLLMVVGVAMRVQLSRPDLVLDLLAFLEQGPDTVARAGGRGRVDVSILGSRNADSLRLELDCRLDGWRALIPAPWCECCLPRREGNAARYAAGETAAERIVVHRTSSEAVKVSTLVAATLGTR